MLWVQNRKKNEWMKGWEKKMFNKLYFICIKIKGISWDRVMMRSLLKRVWLKNIHVSFIYSIQYGVHGSVSATFFKHFKNVSKFVLTWRGYCGMINIDNNSKKNSPCASLCYYYEIGTMIWRFSLFQQINFWIFLQQLKQTLACACY